MKINLTGSITVPDPGAHYAADLRVIHQITNDLKEYFEGHAEKFNLKIEFENMSPTFKVVIK